MSKAALEAFRAKLESDPVLRAELTRTLSAGGSKATASMDELIAFAKTCGFELSSTDVLASTELSDDMLDAVAGGGSQFDCSELVQWASGAQVALPAPTIRDYFRRIT